MKPYSKAYSNLRWRGKLIWRKKEYLTILWAYPLNSYSNRVGLLPGDWRSPGVEPHLVGQRLWDGQQYEADVGQSDEGRHQHHQVIAITGREVRADGRAGDQTRCERRRHLEPLNGQSGI